MQPVLLEKPYWQELESTNLLLQSGSRRWELPFSPFLLLFSAGSPPMEWCCLPWSGSPSSQACSEAPLLGHSRHCQDNWNHLISISLRWPRRKEEAKSSLQSVSRLHCEQCIRETGSSLLSVSAITYKGEPNVLVGDVLDQRLELHPVPELLLLPTMLIGFQRFFSRVEILLWASTVISCIHCSWKIGQSLQVKILHVGVRWDQRHPEANRLEILKLSLRTCVTVRKYLKDNKIL